MRKRELQLKLKDQFLPPIPVRQGGLFLLEDILSHEQQAGEYNNRNKEG